MTDSTPPPSGLTDANLDRVLRANAGDYHHHGLWWRRIGDDTELRVYVNCSDFFFWGCSDVEELHDDNVETYLGALADARAVTEAVTPGWDRNEGTLLFCARTRNHRPQGAYYPALHSATWPLFDAAGPDYPTGLGNPHAHPSTKPDVTGSETKYKPGICNGVPVTNPTLPSHAGPAASPATVRRAFEILCWDDTEDLTWGVDAVGDLRVYCLATTTCDKHRTDVYEALEITDANIDDLERVVTAARAADPHAYDIGNQFVAWHHANTDPKT